MDYKTGISKWHFQSTAQPTPETKSFTAMALIAAIYAKSMAPWPGFKAMIMDHCPSQHSEGSCPSLLGEVSLF